MNHNHKKRFKVFNTYQPPSIQPVSNHIEWIRLKALLSKEREKKNFDHRKKRGVKRNCLSWFWTILCTIGMIYQIVDTTIEYLNYYVNSEVGIRLDYDFDIPAMGLCFNPVQFTNEKLNKICPRRNETYGNMKKCFREKIASQLSLNEIIGNLNNDLVSRVRNKDDKLDIDTYYKGNICLDINLKSMRQNLSTITKGSGQST